MLDSDVREGYYIDNHGLERKLHHDNFKDFMHHDVWHSVKESHHSLRDWLSDKKDGIIDILANTKREIIVFGIVGILAGSAWQYKIQSAKTHSYKIGYSETTNIEEQARAMGINVPHAANFTTKAFDFYMNIFEANNKSWEKTFGSDNTKRFASELDINTEITLKQHHYNIPLLEGLVAPLGDSLLHDYQYLVDLRNNAQLDVNLFKQSWKDTHHDEYHTEYDTYTDSDGEEHTTPREVYDYTDNDYKYFKWAGEQASDKLDSIRVWFPMIYIKDQFLPTNKVGAENEYEMEKSRKKELKGRRLTEEEKLQIANSSQFGSRPYTDLRAIDNYRGLLMQNGERWHIDKKTAKNEFHRTYDYSHAEPKEFKTRNIAMDNGNAIIEVTDLLINSIKSTDARVITLTDMIHQYIDGVYLPSKHINVKKLKSRIMSETIKGYNELFPGGASLDAPNWWYVLLWGGIGGVGLGSVGWGFSNWADRTNFYDRFRRKRKEEYT